jgi:predicted dienelactone hydrolase
MATDTIIYGSPVKIMYNLTNLFGEGIQMYRQNLCLLRFLLFSVLCFYSVIVFAWSPTYDPLEIYEYSRIEIVDMVVRDEVRKRDIPILIYLPSEKKRVPVILFSHGLGGSRYGCSYLGYHWSSRGYIVVYIQHPGSDASIWQGLTFAERQFALTAAANTENFLLRVKDVSVVLDYLLLWNDTPYHFLESCLDLEHIGMAGYSFGAVTTQAVSGQVFFPYPTTLTDERIRAALLLSPSYPSGQNLNIAFSNVCIPWMLMTGTRDVSPIKTMAPDERLKVFQALPPGGKYEVVLFNAEHSVFSDSSSSFETGSQNPNHHRVILALSTAFWDTWLYENKEAKDWLDGSHPYEILEENDRWQKK